MAYVKWFWAIQMISVAFQGQHVIIKVIQKLYSFDQLFFYKSFILFHHLTNDLNINQIKVI